MEQLDIFNFIYEKKKITKPIKLIELFAGIGSQAKALENLGANFTRHKVVEFDPAVIKTYNAVHGTSFEPIDITTIHAQDLDIRERERDEYLVTYSFPCTDLSLAGNKKGMAKGSGTRSGLLWEVERILNECGTELPQVLLMENVPQIISKANIDDFKQWELFLESKGYTNYIKILNSKDYGIPQNRKRCFMVSLLGEYSYTFPKKQKLTLTLGDMLEDNVDEKYYLTQEKIQMIQSWKAQQKPLEQMKKNIKISPTLTARGAGEEHSGMVLIDELLIKDATKKGYRVAHAGDGVDISTRMETHRGTVQKKTSLTIKTQADVGVAVNQYGQLKIRKLTEKEAWLLMGFSSDDYEKAEKVTKPTKLYFEAGNSIVVNVLMAIFKEML